MVIFILLYYLIWNILFIIKKIFKIYILINMNIFMIKILENLIFKYIERIL